MWFLKPHIKILDTRLLGFWYVLCWNYYIMYELGERLYFSKGSQYNIKITTAEDLDLFEGYVLLKQKRENEVTIKTVERTVR